MGRVTMTVKRKIYKDIESSLPRYDQWKMNPRAVPATEGAYLEMLGPAVERYVDGLVDPEKTAVEYYLAGIKPHAVLAMSKIQRAKVTRADLRKWLFGDADDWGLIITMFRIFTSRMEFCPFCHGAKWSSGGSPHPRVNGNPCPHQEMWLEQEMKEGKE